MILSSRIPSLFLAYCFSTRSCPPLLANYCRRLRFWLRLYHKEVSLSV